MDNSWKFNVDYQLLMVKTSDCQLLTVWILMHDGLLLTINHWCIWTIRSWQSEFWCSIIDGQFTMVTIDHQLLINLVYLELTVHILMVRILMIYCWWSTIEFVIKHLHASIPTCWYLTCPKNGFEGILNSQTGFLWYPFSRLGLKSTMKWFSLKTCHWNWHQRLGKYLKFEQAVWKFYTRYFHSSLSTPPPIQQSSKSVSAHTNTLRTCTTSHQ